MQSLFRQHPVVTKLFFMLHSFFTGTLVALFLFFFEAKEPAAHFPVQEKDTTGFYLDSVKWNLVKIYEAESAVGVTGKNTFIRFDLQKGAAGGKGGCNSFGSTLQVNGNTIHISDIFSTKMYCEGIQATENNFFRQLEAATSYEIKGKTLLLYAEKKVVLEFEAE